MKLSFAPLEGLTGEVYRRAHAEFFGGADRYYAPFFSPSSIGLSEKQRREVDAAQAAGESTVFQLLTKNPTDFLTSAAQLSARGCTEVNLNIGCPSGTVTAKGKGAGALRDPDALDSFFDVIFGGLSAVAPTLAVSVKTRVGYESEALLPALMEVFNRYPIAELIVHPRLRSDMYRGKPRMEAFAYCVAESRAPVAYNGDIFTAEDYHAVHAACPTVSHILCGRGAMADPALFSAIRGEVLSPAEKKERLRAMHDRILEENRRLMGDGRNLLCRMADIWNYQIYLFDTDPRAASAIRRAATVSEYRAAVATLFRERALLPDGAYKPRE